MRGKDSAGLTSGKYPGITPAHAGKSLAKIFMQGMQRDHPRTCGEKIQQVLQTENILGSPPHMRGKEEYDTNNKAIYGITPAHAGKRYLPPSL